MRGIGDVKSLSFAADEDPSNRSHQGCKGVDNKLGSGSMKLEALVSSVEGSRQL